jgi:hypothetical protein
MNLCGIDNRNGIGHCLSEVLDGWKVKDFGDGHRQSPVALQPFASDLAQTAPDPVQKLSGIERVLQTRGASIGRTGVTNGHGPIDGLTSPGEEEPRVDVRSPAGRANEGWQGWPHDSFGSPINP